MNKTINELVALTELANDDELIVFDASEGTSKKIKKSDFVTTSIASGNQKPPTSDAVADALNGTPIKKNIAYSYTGSPANLEEIIKQIIEDQLNYSTTETNTYTGQISSTHTGSGDFGVWDGTYLISVIKNNTYGTNGFVSAQGYGFNVMLENGTIVVERFTSRVKQVSVTPNATYITNLGSNAWVNCYKNGKLVTVNVEVANQSANLPVNTFCIIATGLPIPANNVANGNITIDDINIYKRMWVNTASELIIWVGGNYTGNIFATVTYIEA